MAIKVSPKKISELVLAGTLTGAEQIAVVQANQTVRTLLSSMQSYIEDNITGHTLVSRPDQVCTGADTLETFLQTYTLEGGTLASDGQWLDIYASGTFAANANTKLVTFYFGGTSFSNVAGAFSSQANAWEIKAKVQRSTNTTQKGSVAMLANLTSGAAASPIGNSGIINPTETLSSDVAISISATNGTANANDICIDQFIIVHHKLDPNT